MLPLGLALAKIWLAACFIYSTRLKASIEGFIKEARRSAEGDPMDFPPKTTGVGE
jgi:hypothetical protein